MKQLIKILNIIFDILLVIAISVFIFANLATSTVLSKEYVIEQFEKNGYYNKVENETKNVFENYIGQSGLEPEVLENIISGEQIKKDIKTIIQNIYENENIEIDTTELEQNLRNNIEKTLKNKELNITQENAIQQYIDLISKQYKETILHINYQKNISSVISNANKYIDIAIKSSGVAIIVILLIILALNRKIYRVLEQVAISLTSCGVLFVILNIFINSKIKVDNILILSVSISEIIRNIIKFVLTNIMNYGLALLIGGILLIIVMNIIGTKNLHVDEDDD